jgi:hypothetical protein
VATFTNKKLVASALTTTLSTYYTVPAATKAVIAAITLCNTGAAAARLVTVVIAGITVLSRRSLAVDETLALTFPHVLETADVIQAKQDVGTDVHLYVSGLEVT